MGDTSVVTSVDTSVDTSVVTSVDKTTSNITIELNDYKLLLNNKISRFLQTNTCCLALTQNFAQCKNCKIPDDTEDTNYNKNIVSNLFCKLHKHKKYKPKYIVIYIDINYAEKKDTPEHIITYYPYTKKEQYYKDIEIYKNDMYNIYKDKLIKFTNITNCKVCNDTYAHNELIKCNNATCDNEHLTCTSCLSGYIDSQITSNIGTYECMFNKTDKCCGEYIHNTVDTIITTNEKLSIWKDLVSITDTYKLANICDDYIICPLCRKWGCILDTPVTLIDPFYIKCMSCKLEWCTICKRKAHDSYSCYKIIFTPDEIKNIDCVNTIIDTMIQDIISKALTHKCSTCGCAYIKEEGCNLMYCEHCHGMTCYICNAKIYYKEGLGKYWHFAGHEHSQLGATCPVWNNTAQDGKEKQGNTEYNNKTIITELMLFLNDNDDTDVTDTTSTRKLIYNRIKYLYEKDVEFTFIFEEFNKLDIK
jgi:hypothetical protein